MLFNSWAFVVFFVVVFFLYHSLSLRGQNVLLLLASYFFYGWWDWRFLSLLWISTMVDFSVARAMDNAEGRRRKILLFISVATNLGILGFFKYFNFFADSAAAAIEALGLQPHLPVLRVILPVGISFYTFQTMAYTIDVYRGRIRPTDRPLLFAIYVSYFPQLVAGPIERAQHLLPQFSRKRCVDEKMFASGCLLILVGYVRKVVIADGVSEQVNMAFADPGTMTGLNLVMAVLLFALQIYGDFAGYSDIARGISRLLGIELMENFRHPYFATNITAFWRRWHISLSSWLRDYLYVPLGGNRGPSWFVYRNLMLTMLLGGLWHGAAWTFVVWGGLHGVALAVHKLWLRGNKPVDPPVWDGASAVFRSVLGWIATMLLVGLAWVFFRAPDFGTAFEVVTRIVTLEGGLHISSRLVRLAGTMMLLLLLIDMPQALRSDQTAVLSWPWPIRGVVYATLVLCLAVMRVEENVQFIYFQF